MKGKKITGRYLSKVWNVNVLHSLYREDGKWYHVLKQFPGALFDKNGYIVFNSEKEYLECNYLKISKELHIIGGISEIPGYVRVVE